MSARRPRAVVFDVVETLFSLAPVADALRPTGVGLDLFFSRLLRDAFALSAAGDFRSFPEVARSAMTALSPSPSAALVDDVIGSFGRLPPYPDVRPAFEALGAADVTVAALSNGSGRTTRALLERVGLAGHVEQVLSVDDVGVWKPSPQPYRYAAASLGRQPDEVAMVAVHAWDVHGARRAGLTTGWCARLEGRYPQVFEHADVSGNDLVAVSEGLLRLPG